MATLFGVLVFVSKIIIPTPFDEMAIAPQAVLLPKVYMRKSCLVKRKKRGFAGDIASYHWVKAIFCV
jgi:hypothetical protein